MISRGNAAPRPTWGDRSKGGPAAADVALYPPQTEFRLRPGEGALSIIGWIILGLIAGFIASKIVNKQGSGIIVDILLGIVGAVVGGFIFAQLGSVGVTGFNLW